MHKTVLVAILGLFALGRAEIAFAEPEAALPIEAEDSAKDAIRALRKSSRTLRRVASKSRAGEFSAWLKRASKNVDTLSKRWQNQLVLYNRDFPPEALRDDPARLDDAKTFLSETNQSFDRQVVELRARLLEEHGRFEAGSGISDSQLQQTARAIEALP